VRGSNRHDGNAYWDANLYQGSPIQGLPATALAQGTTVELDGRSCPHQEPAALEL
jgi:hypothetical protein